MPSGTVRILTGRLNGTGSGRGSGRTDGIDSWRCVRGGGGKAGCDGTGRKGMTSSASTGGNDLKPFDVPPIRRFTRPRAKMYQQIALAQARPSARSNERKQGRTPLPLASAGKVPLVRTRHATLGSVLDGNEPLMEAVAPCAPHDRSPALCQAILNREGRSHCRRALAILAWAFKPSRNWRNCFWCSLWIWAASSCRMSLSIFCQAAFRSFSSVGSSP